VALGFVADRDAGAVHVAEVDGREVESLDTRGITAPEHANGAVLRLGPLSAGPHEIRCAVTAGGTTAFDYWQVEQPAPPLVLVPLAYPAADWTAFKDWPHTPDNAGMRPLNDTIRAVAAEFGEGVVCVETEPVLDGRPELYGHAMYPSDDGHQELARAMHEAVLAEVQKTGVSV
jgi:hypothetical protein